MKTVLTLILGFSLFGCASAPKQDYATKNDIKYTRDKMYEGFRQSDEKINSLQESIDKLNQWFESLEDNYPNK